MIEKTLDYQSGGDPQYRSVVLMRKLLLESDSRNKNVTIDFSFFKTQSSVDWQSIIKNA